MAVSVLLRFTFYFCCFGSKRKIWKYKLCSCTINTLKKSAMEYILDALVKKFPKKASRYYSLQRYNKMKHLPFFFGYYFIYRFPQNAHIFSVVLKIPKNRNVRTTLKDMPNFPLGKCTLFKNVHLRLILNTECFRRKTSNRT